MISETLRISGLRAVKFRPLFISSWNPGTTFVAALFLFFTSTLHIKIYFAHIKTPLGFMPVYSYRETGYPIISHGVFRGRSDHLG